MANVRNWGRCWYYYERGVQNTGVYSKHSPHPPHEFPEGGKHSGKRVRCSLDFGPRSQGRSQGDSELDHRARAGTHPGPLHCCWSSFPTIRWTALGKEETGEKRTGHEIRASRIHKEAFQRSSLRPSLLPSLIGENWGEGLASAPASDHYASGCSGFS